KLHDVIGTIIAPIRRKLLGLYAKSSFYVPQRRKQFRAVIGMTPAHFVMKDHPGTILHQLQRATKLDGLVKLAFADWPDFRVVKRNDAFGDRFASLKLLLSLAQNRLGQFNLLPKPLLALGRPFRRPAKRA